MNLECAHCKVKRIHRIIVKNGRFTVCEFCGSIHTKDDTTNKVICNRCKGQAKYNGENCTLCKGTGLLTNK